MSKFFKTTISKLKNIVSFNPENNPNESTNDENTVFLKIENNKLIFEILSFRYLLIGKEDVETSDNIEMILPLKRLQDIIKKFPDNTEISFEQIKDTIKIEVSDIKYNIRIPNERDRNKVSIDKKQEYKVDRDSFLKSIKKVKIAMSDDDARYYLNGINIEVYKDQNDNIYPFLAASNGSMLAVSRKKENEWTFLQKAIIPRKIIPEIIKILEKAESEIFISFDENKMDIKTNSLEIIFKLVDGEFPDYNAVIPYNNDKIVLVKNTDLKSIVEKTTLISIDKAINVKLTILNNNLNIEISSSDGSQASSDIKANYSGEEIKIVLNSKYLLEILEQISDDNLLLKVKDNVSSLLIEQEKNKDLLFVLMPIRI